MAKEFTFKGIKPGDNFNLSRVVNGANVGDENIPAFLVQPLDLSMPRISVPNGQFHGETWSIDTGNLSSPGGHEWRDEDGNLVLTGTTYTPSMGETRFIRGRVVSGGVTYDTPLLQAMHDHGGEHGRVMLAAQRKFAHTDATHIAMTNGPWSFKSTWSSGVVPGAGSRVIVPKGIHVIFDNEAPGTRLNWVRIDGKVSTAQDKSVNWFYETLVIFPGGELDMGRDNATRLPKEFRNHHLFSGKRYEDLSYDPGYLDLTEDSELAFRGLINWGTMAGWGHFKDPWLKMKPAMSGSTSVELMDRWGRELASINWETGDELIIGGTSIHLSNNNQDMAHECEYRVITGVSGSTVSFADPLVYDHIDKRTFRTDLLPPVALRNGRNIIFESEVVDDNMMRGHVMTVGTEARSDMWGCAFINLGRSHFGKPVGAVEDLSKWSPTELENAAPGELETKDGQFKFKPASLSHPAPNGTEWEDMTNQSNVKGRYGAMHFHELGWDKTPETVSQCVDCYVEGAIGWAFVDHNGLNALTRNVVHDWIGAAFVGEGAPETGPWVDNLSIGARVKREDHIYGYDLMHFNSMKSLESAAATGGWWGRYGHANIFRGRVNSSNRNFGCSCINGNLFQHRGPQVLGKDKVSHPSNLDRSTLTFGTMGALQKNMPLDTMIFHEHPIRGLNDFEGCGILQGFFVLKDNPAPSNDANTHIKNMKLWGVRGPIAAEFNYIGVYVAEGFDVTADVGNDDMKALGAIGAAMQVAFVNHTSSHAKFHIQLGGGNSGGRHEKHSQDDPRFMLFGNEGDFLPDEDSLVKWGQPHDAGTDPGSGYIPLTQEVTQSDIDVENTRLQWELKPYHTYPRVTAHSNNDGNVTLDATAITNADGKKVDNVSALGEVAPRPQQDNMMIPNNDFNITARWLQDYGYWQDGSGNNVIKWEDITSDRTTAISSLDARLVVLDPEGYTPGVLAGLTDHGPLNMAGTDPAHPDMVVSTPENTPLQLDLGSLATGGDGTYYIHSLNHIPPDNGKVQFDGGTLFTYNPDLDFHGQDWVQIFLGSGHRYVTVIVKVLVGGDHTIPLPAPTIGTNATDNIEVSGGSGVINYTCKAPMLMEGRKVLTVQYRLDGGTPTRAGHRWKGMLRQIATAPGTYNIEFRCWTDLEKGYTPWSTAVPVTVS